MKADRYNENKPRYTLVSQPALAGLIGVLEYGANKYSADNWQKGLSYKSIIDCMMRHINAMLVGEMEDPESGLLHIDHVQSNAMFLSHYINSMRYKEFDDLCDESSDRY